MSGIIQKMISSQVWRQTPLIPALGAEAGASFVNLMLAWSTESSRPARATKWDSPLKKRAKEIISTSLYLNVKERRQLERNHMVQSSKQAKSQLKRSLCYLWSHDWGDKTEALKGAENVLYLKPSSDYMVCIFILKNSMNRAGNGSARALSQPLGDRGRKASRSGQHGLQSKTISSPKRLPSLLSCMHTKFFFSLYVMLQSLHY